MRATFSGLAFGLLIASALLAGPAAAETLKVAGTGGAMPAIEKVAAEFLAASGISIEAIPGLGSKGAIKAAADGVIGVAISARLLSPDEIALGLTAVPFARTALVFVTSRPGPDDMKSTDLTGIFRSSNPKWPDGTPIRVILRTTLDADTLILEQLFPGMHEAVAAARLRPEIPVAPTDQDSADLAQSLEGSFVQAGYSQIITEKRNLRFVSIDAIAPTVENFASGKYPYGKIFYLVYSAASKPAAERLLDFLRSPRGQELLRSTGNLPVAG